MDKHALRQQLIQDRLNRRVSKEIDVECSVSQYIHDTRITKPNYLHSPSVYNYHIVTSLLNHKRNEKYVVVIVFRNQEDKIIRCLDSIPYKNRSDIGILIVNDNSDDRSNILVHQYINENNLKDRITFLTTLHNYGKTCNVYNAHNRFISDESICVILDGDDYLNTDNIDVFKILDEKYDTEECLCTIGSYVCTEATPHLDMTHVNECDFNNPWDGQQCPSWLALRSFKNYLFKSIPITQFKEINSDTWLVYGDDIAYMPYIVENSNGRCAFIKDVLYVYDTHGHNHWFYNENVNVEDYVIHHINKIPSNLFGKSSTRYASNEHKVEHQLVKIAYYLPQFHPCEINDKHWGNGFTEWTNALSAKPLYTGHYQPHIPADLGKYDLRSAETRHAQAELAREYGIDAFCYWHYWFSAGNRVLNMPIDEVVKLNEPDFPFCLGWANESWTGIWHGKEDTILAEQEFVYADISTHFYEILHILKDKRYYRYNNKMLFIILDGNHCNNYISTMMHTWQELARSEGLGEFHFVVHSMYNKSSLHTIQSNVFADYIDMFSYKGIRHLYKDYIDYSKNIPCVENEYPVIYSGWDNTPRCSDRGIVLDGYNPDLFYEHCVNELNKTTVHNNIVFIKSWNEWAEGNYLEPDKKYGRAFLESLKSAFRR